MLAVLRISLRAGLPVLEWTHDPVSDASAVLPAILFWLVLRLVDLHLADSSDVSHCFLGMPPPGHCTTILIDPASSAST